MCECCGWGQREEARWRMGWDTVFSVASAALAVLLGVAFGNIVQGVPLDQQGNVTINNVLDLLHPFALLVGATTVVMLALHGALYLNLKTEGDLQARTRRLVPLLMAGFVPDTARTVATEGGYLRELTAGLRFVRSAVALDMQDYSPDVETERRKKYERISELETMLRSAIPAQASPA